MRQSWFAKKTQANSKKNTYLIAINVTNKQKERYYHEYIPDLLDVSSFIVPLVLYAGPLIQ